MAPAPREGGKRHDVPAHHRAGEALDDCLEAAGPGEAKAVRPDQLALDGVRRVVRRLEAGLVGGVEGLDANAGSVCRVSGALHPPQVRCVSAVSTPCGHTKTR